MNKVISMVPSWTETLLECGINVVGRTRFCIHPAEKIKSISIVGGTKDIDWNIVNSLQAEFLVLDKEENIKDWEMQSPLKNLITHVQDIPSLISGLKYLSTELQNDKLLSLAKNWAEIQASPATSLEKIPGFVKWLRKEKKHYSNYVYLIWRNPWISVSGNTFIGSLLQLYGINLSLAENAVKYPKSKDLDFSDDTLLLFSTEPYPFHKKLNELTGLPYDSALIDGEALSWFGIRSYRFLTRNL